MESHEHQSTLIVLLGNENDVSGTLKLAAQLRADEAIKILHDNSNSIVIPTGTFGAFNPSDTPHGKLLSKYLTKKGIALNRILPHTKSTNTLEDAYAVLRYMELGDGLNNNEISKIIVVTSAFHMPRVKFIFGHIFQDIQLDFKEAPDPEEIDQDAIGKTEKKKLEYLKMTWVNIEGFDLNTFPADSYNNAGSELRHYDNLSQFSLTGAAVLFGLAISGDLKGLFFFGNLDKPDNNLVQELLQIFVPLVTGIALTILIFLYHKFADTAASSRRLLYTIEKLYQVPGLSSTQTRTRFLGLSLPAQKAVDWIYYLMIALLLVIFLAKLVIAISD